jgi:predicted outer membrane repeat protein
VTKYITYYTIIFDGNTADYGGALYIADDTISGTCASTSIERPSSTIEYFLQTLELRPLFVSPMFIPNYVTGNTTCKFINNRALFHRSDLFGGILDHCTYYKKKKKSTT